MGGGAEATAQRVTLANDSTGVLTVDAGAASGIAWVNSASALTAPHVNASGEPIVDTGGGIALLTSDLVAAGANVALVAATPGLRLYYITSAETTNAAGARFVLRHGTGESDEQIIRVHLATNESVWLAFPGGIDCADGIFFDWLDGAIDLNIATKTRTP